MPDRKYFNNRRQKRRELALQMLGGKCQVCGTTENLQFDHKNPEEKEFRIADRLDAPLDILTREIQKCNLLCRSCHQKKTNENREHGQPEARHGTLHMYKKYKCRCEECRAYMSDYNKRKISQILNFSKSFMKIAMKAKDKIEPKIFLEYQQLCNAIEMNLDEEGLTLPQYIEEIMNKGDNMSLKEFETLREYVGSMPIYMLG